LDPTHGLFPQGCRFVCHPCFADSFDMANSSIERGNELSKRAQGALAI
jgi:hypothetical protein